MYSSKNNSKLNYILNEWIPSWTPTRSMTQCDLLRIDSVCDWQCVRTVNVTESALWALFIGLDFRSIPSVDMLQHDCNDHSIISQLSTYITNNYNIKISINTRYWSISLYILNTTCLTCWSNIILNSYLLNWMIAPG